MAMQPLQSIVYQVDDECFPASHCSKIAQFVSVWVHGQQHLACKLFIFPLLKDLHADRENPNQLPVACVLVRSLKSHLSERGEWCGKKGRAAALGVCMQPQHWGGNIPSRVLRYEARSSNKNCWSTLEPLRTQQILGWRNCHEPWHVQESLGFEVFCFKQ